MREETLLGIPCLVFLLDTPHSSVGRQPQTVSLELLWVGGLGTLAFPL